MRTSAARELYGRAAPTVLLQGVRFGRIEDDRWVDLEGDKGGGATLKVLS